MLSSTVVVLLLFAFSRGQIDCPNLSTCGECIQRPECAWCQNPKGNSVINCASRTDNDDDFCDSEDLMTAQPKLEVIENQNLSSDPTAKSYVQIKPQHIKLEIQKHEEYKYIDFKVSRAENPLDLYFLMDASYTMKNYKDIISKLGQELAKAITKETADYQIGFGTFVDKTVTPFGYPPEIKPNCQEHTCITGYSFKNHLSLVNNISEFESQVKNSKISSNVDAPEGGLEALMQVIVCKKEIGWRKSATHLVVFITDASSHIAGDGRLGGVLLPNDGECHMSNNEYNKDNEFDYPSVSHINFKSEQNDIHIIFAIAEDKTLSEKKTDQQGLKLSNLYKEMSKQVKLSKYSPLTENGAVIIKLVVGTYRDILQSVKMDHDFDKDKFEVNFLVKCPNSSNFEKNNTCTNVKVNDEIEFKAEIKASECNEPGRQYNIKPNGIDESLKIDLEVICKCDCEKNVTNPPDSFCNNNGYKVCGKCSCFEGFSGNNCECTKTDVTNDNVSACNDTQTGLLCNNKGTCKCGVCNCHNNYYGTFCSCEDLSCPRKNNQLCNGPDSGKCKCGICECLPDWTGTDCACPSSNKKCIAPYSDVACSGKGECSCGVCKCEPDYFGDYCQICKGCEWCPDLDPCVEAYLKDLEPSEANSLRINCSSVIITPRENATASSYDRDWNKCLLSGKLGCNTVYKYKLEGAIFLVEMGEEICPFIASIGGLLLAILLPILLGGIIAFLAWKGIVTAKDNREYASFLKKKEQEKWNTEGNPLYKPAQTTYMNPLFNQPKKL